MVILPVPPPVVPPAVVPPVVVRRSRSFRPRLSHPRCLWSRPLRSCRQFPRLRKKKLHPSSWFHRRLRHRLRCRQPRCRRQCCRQPRCRRSRCQSQRCRRSWPHQLRTCRRLRCRRPRSRRRRYCPPCCRQPRCHLLSSAQPHWYWSQRHPCPIPPEQASRPAKPHQMQRCRRWAERHPCWSCSWLSRLRSHPRKT